MTLRDAFSPTGIMYIASGIYFLIIAGLNEGSVYSVIVALFCFISFGLSFKNEWFFTGPWKVATSVFVLALTGAQLISDSYSAALNSATNVVSILINGALFILFLGVALATANEIVKRETKEESEEKEKEESREEERRRKEAKKLTYEV